MKTITGSGPSELRDSRPGVSGVTTLSVRQSSLIGWYLPTPVAVYMRCCGAQLANEWQCRTPRQGTGGCGAR